MNKKILLWGLSAILIIQSYSFSNDNDYRILQPDNSIGRKTKVLANKVVVRIKQEYSNIYSAESIIKKFDKNVTIDNSFLKPSQSVTFNSKLREKTKSNVNLVLSNIIKAEEPLLRTYKVKYDGDKSPEDYCKELMVEAVVIYYVQNKDSKSYSFFIIVKKNNSWNIFFPIIVKKNNSWNIFFPIRKKYYISPRQYL